MERIGSYIACAVVTAIGGVIFSIFFMVLSMDSIQAMLLGLLIYLCMEVAICTCVICGKLKSKPKE